MDLRAVLTDAQRILTEAANQANKALGREDPKEAKRLLIAAQRDLRGLKREVTAAERDMRAEFQQARLNANKSGQVIGAFGGSKMRGALAHGRVAEKRRLAEKQAAATNAYRKVKDTIDDFVAQLDDAKFKVGSEVARQAQAGPVGTDANKLHERAAEAASTARDLPLPTPPPPPPPTPPTWAADPFGRYELRYWDGAAWTEHVSTGGVQSTDPAK